ncbi:MAG: hypothetical protein DMD35_10660 [Gemmatimonadetes bacterium]|nr:MAG: hypothetical protein DMD35_10660 [Gemmatimonadota bacterium]
MSLLERLVTATTRLDVWSTRFVPCPGERPRGNVWRMIALTPISSSGRVAALAPTHRLQRPSPLVCALVERVRGYVGSLGERQAEANAADTTSETTAPAAGGMRLCGYFERVAQLAEVRPGRSRRSAYDPRIDAVSLHLAAVHSMPLHRIVELVANAIARRARNGAASSGRRGRGMRGRGRSDRAASPIVHE